MLTLRTLGGTTDMTMRNKGIWRDAGELDVERLGLCHAYHRMVQGEYHQWKIKHGLVEAIGDFSLDNTKALVKRFYGIKKEVQINIQLKL